MSPQGRYSPSEKIGMGWGFPPNSNIFGVLECHHRPSRVDFRECSFLNMVLVTMCPERATMVQVRKNADGLGGFPEQQYFRGVGEPSSAQSARFQGVILP